MGDCVIYDNKITPEIEQKLKPIGHPNPLIGIRYNCHGWALGYKAWLNVEHQRNGYSLEEVIQGVCKTTGLDEGDIFTNEVTYAKSETKKLISTTNDGCVKGAIAVYYKSNDLTHTARFREKSDGSSTLIWTSKLGSGHVVEHQDPTDLVLVYGDIIDFYNIDSL